MILLPPPAENLDTFDTCWKLMNKTKTESCSLEQSDSHTTAQWPRKEKQQKASHFSSTLGYN